MQAGHLQVMEPSERFDALYEEHAGAVLAYALRRTSPANADDALAEVMLIAWRRLDEAPVDARAWLLGVTRRVLANQRRGSMRQLALKDRLSRDAPAERSGQVDEAVLEALAGLRKGDREVLMLVAWEGLSNREAAAVLGISPKTFGVRIHRARARLARELEAVDGGRTNSIPAEVL
jgi:RNA polymerase sigma-70 factor (ECF subfamily)